MGKPMKKIVLGICGIFVALGLSQAVQAGNFSHCDSFTGCKSKESLWDVGLWGEGGLFANQYGQKNKYNAAGDLMPYSGNTTLLGNVRQSDGQLNQLWVYGQKKLSKRGFDTGGRVDFGFGTDMLYLQAANLEYDYTDGDDPWNTGDYYTAFPQLYGEIGYDNVSLKFGKFLSTFGYESIMAPERFFYSMCHAYRHRPATQTGAVVIWDVNKNFSVFGGWTNGQDQFFENGDDNAFLGGFDWNPSCRAKFGYSVMAGKETDDFWQRPFPVHCNYFTQSFYADLKLTERFNYVFEWTVNTSSQADNYGVYGINNELFYKLNCRWTLGARVEWLHTYRNAGLTESPSREDDIFAVTLGLNWKPTRWLTFKPEIRYDVCDQGTPFNRSKSNDLDMKKDQLSGGVSMVVHF